MKQHSPAGGWTPATFALYYLGVAILWAYLLIGMYTLDTTGVLRSYIQPGFWADFFRTFATLLHRIALAALGLY